MAKVMLAPEFKHLRGDIGGIVLRHMPNGDVIASKAPDMSQVTWSPAQKAQRQRFKAALAYAKEAMADPRVRSLYEQLAQENHKRPFRIAVSEYCKGINRLTD